MRIDIFVTPSEIVETGTKESVNVVIDVLRAGSSMISALYNGCREIIPVETVERALSLKSSLFDSNTLLCGERNCEMVNGFDLGNSPLEYLNEIVVGKSLIFTSTNFSKVITQSKNYSKTFVCSFQNMDKIADRIVELDCGIVISCSGANGRFSLEDFICAGMLVEKVSKKSDGEFRISDSAKVAKASYNIYKDDIKKMVLDSDHGKLLSSLGFNNDIDYCTQVNTHDIIPIFQDRKITKEKI